MIAAKDKKIIVLVGIMGSGKTTIGKRLAKKLKIGFIDSDHEIEKKCRKTINKIFEQDGELYFRQLEKETIAEIIQKNQPSVLSLGGGAFVNDEVRDLIKEKCVSVWLDVALDIVMERIGEQSNRPLLNNVDKREVLAKLILSRSPFYGQCDIRINSDSTSHTQTVNDIIGQLKLIIK